MTITPEQRHQIERAGALRIEDPETHAAYVIVKAEVYERIKPLLSNGQDEIPEGIRRSQEAFFRALPELLEHESLWGQCIAYRGDERIGIAPSDEPLIREINRRGIKDDEFDLFVIRPQRREPEEVSYPSSWCQAADRRAQSTGQERSDDCD
jgi:hypothetical protein